MLRRARPMTSPRMAEIGDVAQRLADGMPAVLTVQQYVAACAHVGYHHPDLTVHAAQLRDWYGSEDGMDLEALLNDCLVLEAAASAAGEALEVQDRQRAALPGIWQGAGAGASAEFLSRHSVASAAVAAALRTASQTLTGLREKLWNAVDSKVEVVIGIEDRVAATRAEWSAAAVTVTTGAGDRAAASELVDQSVKPFVDNAIRTDWLTAMRVAMSTVTSAYQHATAEIAGERLPDFAIPGVLGPVWGDSGAAPRGERLDDSPRAAAPISAASPAPVPGPAGGGFAPTFAPAPATAPAAWSAPPVPAPAEILSAPPEAAAVDAGLPPTLPSSGAAGPGVPGLGGAGGLAGLGQPFADALSGLLGGGGGNSLPEPEALDVPELGGDEEEGRGEDKDEDKDEDEDLDEDEEEEDASTEDLGEELTLDGPDADEPASDPDASAAPAAPVPAPTPPPPPPPAEPLPPAADPVGDEPTPCEIAADELPQVGEPPPSEPGGG